MAILVLEIQAKFVGSVTHSGAYHFFFKDSDKNIDVVDLQY